MEERNSEARSSAEETTSRSKPWKTARANGGLPWIPHPQGDSCILWAFYDHGIRKEDFAEIAFAPGPGGKQEKVALAVYAGKYDIGSVREGTLEVVSEKIDISEIRVLATSRWYPGWLYSARKGLDPAVVGKIRKPF